MNYLIVYAHPNSQSFNNAIKQTLESSLKEKGSVIIRDLYAMNFDPVYSAQELAAAQKGEIPHAIQEEQNHVKWADVILCVFPLWWAAPPAIFRGYVDRIFSKGFAYDFGPGGLQKLLTGKKLQIVTTMGESQENYEKSGMFNSLRQTMGGVIADFTGMEILPMQFLTSVTAVSDEVRKKMLEDLKGLVATL